MNEKEKTDAIYKLVVSKTMPKDQFGFYTGQDLYNDIADIITNKQT